MSRKSNKIERAFYSNSNFTLLDSVLRESLDNRIPDNYKHIVMSEMDIALSQTAIPRSVSRSDRSKFVQDLNKMVLSNIIKKIKHNQQNQVTGWSNSHKESHSSFPPSTNAGFFPKPEDPRNPKNSRNPRNLGNPRIPIRKREITALQDRQMTSHQIQQRSSIHPKQNFEEFPTLPQSTRNTHENVGDAFKRIETERVGLTKKDNPKQVDFSLPKEKDDIDPEERFQKMMEERYHDDKILSQKSNIEQDSSVIKKDNLVDNLVDNESHSPFTSDKFMEGLSESMLNTSSVKDIPDIVPISTPPRSSYHLPEKLKTPENPENPEDHEDNDRVRDIYLTIHSKYRDASVYPSPYDFTMTTDSFDKDSSDVRLNNHLLFISEDKGLDPDLSVDDLKGLTVVECLDVSLPKTLPEVFEEPYLWLCIPEWGGSNRGTGVPKGAFARLKPVPSNINSNFVTMRAHVLERQIVNNDNQTSLSISVLTSDGHPLSFENSSLSRRLEDKDRVYIRCLYPPKSELTNFQPNVCMYSLKYNKKREELSFKMYVTEEKDIQNKIGSFRNEKIKTKLPVNRYLSENDMFFIETPEESQYCKILNVSDDTVIIKTPEKYIKINRIGFLKHNPRGFTSNNKNDVHYTGGVQYKKMSDMLKYDKDSYIMLPKKEQTSFMFRLLQRF